MTQKDVFPVGRNWRHLNLTKTNPYCHFVLWCARARGNKKRRAKQRRVTDRLQKYVFKEQEAKKYITFNPNLNITFFFVILNEGKRLDVLSS